MAIDLSTFWGTWDVVSGNTEATNQYEFWKGMVMSTGQVLNNQYEFFQYHNTTRYEWFRDLQSTYPEVWDEYTFYKNTTDPNIFDFSTFYQYGGQYLGTQPTPTPTPTFFLYFATPCSGGTIIDIYSSNYLDPTKIHYLILDGEAGEGCFELESRFTEGYTNIVQTALGPYNDCTICELVPSPTPNPTPSITPTPEPTPTPSPLPVTVYVKFDITGEFEVTTTYWEDPSYTTPILNPVAQTAQMIINAGSPNEGFPSINLIDGVSSQINGNSTWTMGEPFTSVCLNSFQFPTIFYYTFVGVPDCNP